MKNLRTFEQFVNEANININAKPKTRPFNKVKPGNVGLDFYDRVWTVIGTGKYSELEKFDSAGLSDGFENDDDCVAVKSDERLKTAVYSYGEEGFRVFEGEGQLKNVEMIQQTHVIEYYVDSSLLSDHGMSDQEWAETVADDVSLKDGNLHFEKESFEISGNTKAGNSLLVMQDGEYNMYGGPYEPKMKTPKVTVNGKNILPQVMKAFKSYGWDSKMIDISRTDIWGNIVK